MLKDIIKKIRLQAQMELHEFGEAIGVTAGSVNNYEKGRRTPRKPIVRAIIEFAKAHKIKVNPEDFLDD